MKKILTLIASTIVLGTYASAQVHVQDNDPLLPLSQWKFRLGDDKAWVSPATNDKDWRNVIIPHDWSIEGEFDKDTPAGNDGAYLPTGIGWYRTYIDWSEQIAAQNTAPIMLDFEGVYMNSTVYLNGDSIGGHPYGFIGFSIDITDRLKEGRNCLAVRVNNSEQKNCRWYTGSGIYRNVWLRNTSNPSLNESDYYLRTEQIYGVNADATAADSATVRLSRDGKEDIVKTLYSVRLWSPEHPSMTLVSIDGIQRYMGIRKIEFSTQGLRLNGRDYKLFGGCVHHDNGVIGAASYYEAEYRKATLMKQAGYNAVRTAHNPHSSAFLTACDQIGLLVIDEIFDGLRAKKNKQDYHKLFDQWWHDDVERFVRRDRNHTSVIAWSNGNEVFERRKIEIVTTTRALTRLMHQLDPDRPVTQALCEVDSIFDPQVEAIDIAGYNYLTNFCERDHERCPERIMWLTETYADSAYESWDAVQRLPYVLGDFVWTSIDYLGESGIGRAHYASDPADRGEHWEGSKWPWHGSYCGDMDLTGHRKPISYYREMLWTGQPGLYLAVKEPDCYKDSIICTRWSTWPTTQSWNWPGHEGKPIEVEVYSRHPQIRLYLNDKEIETKACDPRFRTLFTLPYQPGTLRAVGINDEGKEVDAQSIQTAGKAAALRITSDARTKMLKNCLGSAIPELAFFTIELVDANGNVLPDANEELTFTLSGPGTLLGVGNADMTDKASYASHVAAGKNTTKHHLWQGRAIAVVRSNMKPGTITLSVQGARFSKTIKLSCR